MAEGVLAVRSAECVATYSIIAHDPSREEWGVAVQSRSLAVGSIVPWAKAGVGVIATQARANYTYGPRGLELLESGMSADQVVSTLIKGDEASEIRQFAVLDSQGKASAFTGEQCNYWAGHKTSHGISCQGNILVSPEVVDEMYRAYFSREGDLAERLVAALEAAQAAGGDRRGMQSAALVVVREAGGFGNLCDRYIDLRVDDDASPIRAIRRLLDLHRVTFARQHVGRKYRLSPSVREQVASWLCRLGIAVTAENSKTVDELTPVGCGDTPEEWIDGDQVAELRTRVQELLDQDLAQQETEIKAKKNPR